MDKTVVETLQKYKAGRLPRFDSKELVFLRELHNKILILVQINWEFILDNRRNKLNMIRLTIHQTSNFTKLIIMH